MDNKVELVSKIIHEQELIMGPIAWIEARKVQGIQVDSQNSVRIVGQTKTILEALVSRYERLFGQASVVVCREAAQPFIGKVPKTELPAALL